jgi:16S rRNA (guanine(527)-N(7))-methyltransferase RsmG
MSELSSVSTPAWNPWHLCKEAISGLIRGRLTRSPMAKNENVNENLSRDEVALILLPFGGKKLTNSQLASLAKYLELLKKWNQTIPLTSILADREVVARHFGESIFPGSLLRMSCGRLADVGSGAGFPGLPLKIAFPELQVTLLEPNLKKCAFLREVQSALRLPGVEVVRNRYEDFHAAPGSYDFVCSRALGGYKRLLVWSKVVLKPGGQVILWLGTEDSNLLTSVKNWNWALPIKIPESRQRVLLMGTPRP